jgi:hypothetical protein
MSGRSARFRAADDPDVPRMPRDPTDRPPGLPGEDLHQPSDSLQGQPAPRPLGPIRAATSID